MTIGVLFYDIFQFKQDVNEKTIFTNDGQFIETDQSLTNRDVQENCDGISGMLR